MNSQMIPARRLLGAGKCQHPALRLSSSATRAMTQPPRAESPKPCVAAVAGDDRRAIRVLTGLLQAPSNFTVFTINGDATFWKLHGNPEYEAMLKAPKCCGPLF
jgi:hypothetical protein